MSSEATDPADRHAEHSTKLHKLAVEAHRPWITAAAIAFDDLRAEVERLRAAAAEYASSENYTLEGQAVLQRMAAENARLRAAAGIIDKLHAGDFFEDGTLEDGSSWWQMWVDAYGLTDIEIAYIESLDAAALTDGTPT